MQVIIAVDLGSNNFNLTVALNENSKIKVIQNKKKQIKLRNYMDENFILDLKNSVDIFSCLHDFANILFKYSDALVRVVATSTIRQARNSKDFISKAEFILQNNISIIDGIMEAKLIYKGVISVIENIQAKVLAIDIGGGSTEVAFGIGDDIAHAWSTEIGSVQIEQAFFSKYITTELMFCAEQLAMSHLAYCASDANYSDYELAYSSSGIIKAVQLFCKSSIVTLAEVEFVEQKLIQSGSVKNFILAYPEFKFTLIPGGLPILKSIFRTLKIKQVCIVSGGLREGILRDIVQNSI